MKKRFLTICACYFILSMAWLYVFPRLNGQVLAAPSATVRDAQQEDAYTDDSLLSGIAYPVDDTHRLAYTDNLFTGPLIVNYVGGNVKNLGLAYQRAAIKFNLSGITGTVQDAKLKIFVIDAFNHPVVNLIATPDNSWSQTNRKFPKYDPKQIINGYANTAVSPNSWLVFDVTNYLQSAMKDANPAVSFVLKGTEGGESYFNFVSNLEKVQTARRPVLELGFSPSGAAPTVTGPAFSNNPRPTWRWTGSGGGRGTFRYKLDNPNLAVGAVTTTALSLTPKNPLKQGSHTLYVQEALSASPVRWTPSGSFTIEIDTVPPGVPKVSGAAQTNNSLPTWNWTSGGRGNGTYRYKLDNSNLKSDAIIVTIAAFTPDTALSEGKHTLYVQERDEAGNWSASGNFVMTVDLTPPGTPDVTGPAVTNSLTPTWNWKSGGNGNGTYRYKLDDSDLTVEATVTAISRFTPGSALKPGSHTLYVQERDAAGNWSASGSFTMTVDNFPPTVGLFHDHGGNHVKTGDKITITAAFNKDMANTPTLQISRNNLTKLAMSNPGGDHRTWTCLWTVPDGSGEVLMTVTGSDTAGNNFSGDNQLAFTIDNTTPSGYSVAVDQAVVNRANLTQVSFRINNAEPGTYYNYSVFGNHGGTVVKGSGVVEHPVQIVSGIDVSGLKDGLLTLSLALTDAAGNSGNAETAAVTKDTVIPQDYGVTIEPAMINNGNVQTVSFRFDRAEIGTTWNYVIFSSGGGPSVTGRGLVNEAAQTISGIDVQGLRDGLLTLRFTLTDPAGNVGDPAIATVKKDATAPSLTALTHNHPGEQVKAGDKITVTAVFDENMAVSPMIHIINDGAADVAMTRGDRDYRTWRYLWTVPDGNQTTEVAVSGSDQAGNAYPGNFHLTFTIDNVKPAGYSVAIDQPAINSSNQTAMSFHLEGAEPGTTASYTVASDAGGTAVTGRCQIDNAAQAVGPIDVSGLKNGGLAVHVMLSDKAGNAGNIAIASVRKDTGIPLITSLTHDHAGDQVKAKDRVLIAAVFDKEMADQPSISIENGNVSGAAMVNASGDRRAWTYLWTVPKGNAPAVVTISGKDTTGNVYAGEDQLKFLIDNKAPRGYAFSIAQKAINASNKTVLSLRFTGAEVGTTYGYTVSSSGGRTAFARSGAVTSPEMELSGIDVSGLKDGLLTIRFTLSDGAGNEGKTLAATIVKDTVAPEGYSITVDQDMVNSRDGNGFFFTCRGVEVGATYHYSIRSSNGGETLNQSGSINGTVQTISGIDLSGLKDGQLTLNFSLDDGAGNTGKTVVATLKKDTAPPLIVSLNHDHQGNLAKAGEQILVTVVFNKEMAESPLIRLSGSNVPETTLDNPSGDHRTWTYLWAVPDGNTTVDITFAGNDTAGNTYAGDSRLGFIIDNIPPLGYSVAIPQAILNIANQAAFLFTFRGAEKGTTYNYAITSSGGDAVLKNSGIVANMTETLTGIDVSGLKDGILTLRFTLTDAVGNVGSTVTANVTKETSAPRLLSFSHNHPGNLVKAGETVEVTAVFNEDMAYTPTLSLSNSDLTDKTMSNDSGDRRTWTYLWKVPAGNASVIATVAGTDLAGNAFADENSLSFDIDNAAPSGYRVDFNHPVINRHNEKEVSFTLNGAEPGTTCQYTIASDEGDSVIFGSAFIRSATQTISGVDVSGLNDGILSIRAMLVDPVGNMGDIATAAVNKDTKAPDGYRVIIDQTAINNRNQKALSFHFMDAEPGAAYQYTISGSGSGGEAAVDGSGRINRAGQTVPDVDVSGLLDGTLTLRVVLRDGAGNSGSPATTDIVKDTIRPVLVGLTHNSPKKRLKAGDRITIEAIFSKEMADSPRLSITHAGMGEAALTNVNHDRKTWTYLWTVPDGEGPAVVTAAGEDLAGNPYQGDSSLAFVMDNTAPQGYSITSNQAAVNGSNQNALSFTLTGAEPGAAYHYEMSGSGGPAVTGDGLLDGAVQTLSGIDVSSIKDGTLTLRVTLRDAAGNTGTAVTVSLEKDTRPPVITNLKHNHGNNRVRAGETVIITAVFDKSMAATPLITIGNTDVKQMEMNSDSGDHRTWSYVWIVPSGITKAVVTTAGRDNAGNAYNGKDRLIFEIDNTAPAVSNVSPANHAVRADVTTDLVITFNESVVSGVGNIAVYKDADNSVVETIAAKSASVSGAGSNTITVNPATVLDEATTYYIQVDPTAFLDTAGNAFPGISGRNAWNFTTLSTAPTITFLKPVDGSTVGAAKKLTVKVKIATNGIRINPSHILLQFDAGEWLSPVSQSVNGEDCMLNYQLADLKSEPKPHTLTLKVDDLNGITTSKTISFQLRPVRKKTKTVKESD